MSVKKIFTTALRPVLILLHLIPVIVTLATHLTWMDTLAIVSFIKQFNHVYNAVCHAWLQMWMNVLWVHTTAPKFVLTVLDPTPVNAALTMILMMMDIPAIPVGLCMCC